METYNKLPRFHKRFIQEWTRCGNATVAYRMLRPKAKRPRELAYQLRQRPEIMQAFAEYSAEFDRETRDQLIAVKRKVANRANANRLGIYNAAEKTIFPIADWPEGVEDCVEGFDINETTSKVTKIRMAPLNEATRLFLELQRAIVKRNSVEGPDGKPLPAGVARLMIVTQEEASELDAELDAEV